MGTDFLDMEKEYKKVRLEEEKYKVEWEDFQKYWEKDLVTIEQIKDLEKKEEDYKNYLLWIEEIKKHEKKKNLLFLRNIDGNKIKEDLDKNINYINTIGPCLLKKK